MKVCMLKDYLGFSKDEVKDLSEDEGQTLVDAGVAVEVPAGEESDETDVEDTEKNIKSEIDKKATQVEKQVKAHLKKMADRAARSEATKVVVKHEERPHKTIGHWLRDQYEWQANHDTKAMTRLVQAQLYGRKAAQGDSSTAAGLGLEMIPRYWYDTYFIKPTDGYDFFGLCDQVPMEGKQTVNIPADNQVSGGTGVQAAYASEATSLAITKAPTANVQLNVNPLTVVQFGTDQLFRFSPYGIMKYFVEKANRARLWKRNQKTIRGTGTNEPQGILSSPALVTVAKDAGQAAATITFSNIRNMMAASMFGVGDYVWLANNNTLPALYDLKDDNGNAIYLPAAVNTYPNLAWKPAGSLYGDPLLFTEHCSVLGTAGDLIRVSMKSLVAGYAGEDVAESIHVQFLTNETALRVVEYNDVRSLWLSPWTNSNGGDSLSPQITLATRA